MDVLVLLGCKKTAQRDSAGTAILRCNGNSDEHQTGPALGE